MRWEDFVDGEHSETKNSVDTYKTKIKDYILESNKMADGYNDKMAEYQNYILDEFECMMIEKGFNVQKDMEDAKCIVAINSNIRISLCSSKLSRLPFYNRLSLKFLQKDMQKGEMYWYFEMHFEPVNENFKKLRHHSKWSINDNGELQYSSNDCEGTDSNIEFWQREAKQLDIQLNVKREIFKQLKYVSFYISLSNHGGEYGKFNSFREAMDKAIDIS